MNSDTFSDTLLITSAIICFSVSCGLFVENYFLRKVNSIYRKHLEEVDMILKDMTKDLTNDDNT